MDSSVALQAASSCGSLPAFMSSAVIGTTMSGVRAFLVDGVSRGRQATWQSYGHAPLIIKPDWRKEVNQSWTVPFP